MLRIDCYFCGPNSAEHLNSLLTLSSIIISIMAIHVLQCFADWKPITAVIKEKWGGGKGGVCVCVCACALMVPEQALSQCKYNKRLAQKVVKFIQDANQ